MSTIDKDPVAAGIMHCLAIRRLSNFISTRASAESYGGDLSEFEAARDPGHLNHLGRQYEALAEEWLSEEINTAAAAFAAVEFAVAILSDMQLDGVFDRPAPVAQDRDVAFALAALSTCAHWINRRSIEEHVAGIKAGGTGR
jgi:hypothetical protein